MKFYLTMSRRQLVVSADKGGKPGKGIVCHPDHLFTGDNLRNFLEFLKDNRDEGDPEPIDILKELLPDEAKTIDRVVMEQASAAISGKAGPLDRGVGADEFPAFEDGDETE